MISTLTMMLATLSLGAATTAPATTLPAGSSDAQTLLMRALQQYQAARSYEDSVVVATELVVDGRPDIEASAPTKRSLAFVRPGRIALQTPVYGVYSDGTKLLQVVEPWMQYTETAAPKELTLPTITLSQFGFFADLGHPLLESLLTDKPAFDRYIPGLKLTEVKPEPLDGVAGQRVHGTALRDGRLEVPVEIWIDGQTGLVGEIVYDLAKTVQAVPGLTVRRYAQRLRFKDICLNDPLADSIFVFRPGPYVDKTASFKMPSGRELQQRMVGKPAVAFDGKDLEGRNASLADFKGHVLLLDFWRLGCPPCIMSMPTLQKLADKYADRGVSLVGVNLDGLAAKAQITTVLKSRGVKFPQLMQTTPSLAEKYFLEGIPFMVIIDGKGIIQAVHMGPASESELSFQIDKLLKGENLFGAQAGAQPR